MEALLALCTGILAMVAVGIVLWVKGWGSNEHGSGEDYAFLIPGCLMTIVGLIATLTFGIMWGSVYLGSYNSIQRLSAFQNETMSFYVYTINRTEWVVIDISGTREGALTDFSYQQQGQFVSERIKELRNKVELYNEELYGLRAKNRIPLFGAMYYDVPDNLKPISAEPLSQSP